MTEANDPETDFLEQLGQRVRTMRALRGMSRKVLAKVSGISERYIAQLESGKGNVSIVLLRRVAGAMGAHLEDLIPSSEPVPDWAVIRDLLRKAAPGQTYPAVFLSGKIKGQTGIWRSDDQGQNWIRVNDDTYRFGDGGVLTGDPTEFGTVYVARAAGGVVVGRPAK